MTQSTKKPAVNTTHTKTVDEYLAAAPKDKRAALIKLRNAIKAAAPKATESMSYGIAAFKHPSGKATHLLRLLEGPLRPVWDRPRCHRGARRGIEGLRPEQGHDPVPCRQAASRPARDADRQGAHRRNRKGRLSACVDGPGKCHEERPLSRTRRRVLWTVGTQP